MNCHRFQLRVVCGTFGGRLCCCGRCGAIRRGGGAAALEEGGLGPSTLVAHF
jgi:hypothetical protein